MNYAYKTIGQWTKHLITISRDRFGKDIGELTQEELSEASQIIKDFNINEATKQLSNTNLTHNTMKDSVTIQEKDIVIDALKFEIANLRSAKLSIEIEADQISYDLGKMRTEVKDLQSLLGDAFALLNSDEGSTYSFEAQKKDLLSKICNLR